MADAYNNLVRKARSKKIHVGSRSSLNRRIILKPFLEKFDVSYAL
jgi:hypothetical protein